MSRVDQRPSIFLVEDNPADILLLQEALKAKNVSSNLETYQTGESALAELSTRVEENSLPDLVVLDWNLPGINGADVLHTIRQWRQFDQTPVAVLTSSGSPRDRSQALHLGADRYIQKPMTFDEFIDEVGRQIGELLGR
jgi:CheY-like chemotaxis protein